MMLSSSYSSNTMEPMIRKDVQHKIFIFIIIFSGILLTAPIICYLLQNGHYIFNIYDYDERMPSVFENNSTKTRTCSIQRCFQLKKK